jgi:hypothetical protein
VPANPSSPTPAALTRLTHADPRQLQDADGPHLLGFLAAVPDPRAARGRRHPLVAILGLAAAAVLAGARSIAAIAEWAADAPQPVRAALGACRDAPDHFAVPAEAPSAAPFPAWTQTRWPPPSAPGWPTRTVPARQPAAGGGRWPSTARPCAAPAGMDHTSRAVLAQRQVGGAPEEVPGVRPLQDGLDLAGGGR